MPVCITFASGWLWHILTLAPRLEPTSPKKRKSNLGLSLVSRHFKTCRAALPCDACETWDDFPAKWRTVPCIGRVAHIVFWAANGRPTRRNWSNKEKPRSSHLEPVPNQQNTETIIVGNEQHSSFTERSSKQVTLCETSDRGAFNAPGDDQRCANLMLRKIAELFLNSAEH